MYLVILYNTKHQYVMIEIHHNLITKSNTLFTKRIQNLKGFVAKRINSFIKRQLNILNIFNYFG